MTREQLEHAIRAACDIIGDTEVFVFGSQAILGPFPEVPPTFEMSAEADISPKHRLDKVEYLSSIGEDSPFHQAHGFSVHGLRLVDRDRPLDTDIRALRQLVDMRELMFSLRADFKS